VHEQAVSINTDVLSNTTFYAIPQVAITVNNAPTSFDGVTTLTWTETAGSTIQYSPTQASSADPQQTAAIFFLMVSDATRHPRAKRQPLQYKRQSGQYLLSLNGTITNDCTQAPVYSISSSGVLTATVGGVTYTYSTSDGVTFEQFVASTVPGDITTSFSMGSNGVLAWLNPAFDNGQASFCAMNNGTVYVVFQQAAAPSGCLFIQLSLFSGQSMILLQAEKTDR